MSAWYWLLWAILSIANFGALFWWVRRFRGWDAVVIFRNRTYYVTEQQWDLDDNRFRIIAETRSER